MKAKYFYVLLTVALAGAAIAAAPGQRVKYEMNNCPAALAGAVDEQFQPLCSTPASACSKGTCNRGAPDGSLAGMSLQGISAVRLTVCANVDADGGNPHTLKADGGLQVYGWVAAESVWAHNITLDQSITLSERCQRFPDLVVGGQFDRIGVAPSNVWVQLPDGGASDAGLDILIEGQAEPTNHWN